LERVEVLDARPLDIEEVTGEVKVRVRGVELACFTSSFSEAKFVVGEERHAELSLLTFPKSLARIKGEKKEIKPVGGYEIILSGEIVDIAPMVETHYDLRRGVYYTREDEGYENGIVDCGVYIAVGIPRAKLEVGDYIRARGRLDIYPSRPVKKAGMRYLERVEVLDARPLDIEEVTGEVKVRVRGVELACFTSSFKDERFSVGEKRHARLSLSKKVLSKIYKKEKRIRTGGRLDLCVLSGEIVDFAPIVHAYYDPGRGVYYTREDEEHKDGIVDCGVYIAVEIWEGAELEVGDYIRAGGRLYIYTSTLDQRIHDGGC
jgi:hypothetical protein